MRRSPVTIFFAFLRLGCTAFGGPVAHLAYFRRDIVERRKWVDDDTFSQCVALTQLLPGPASSQTGILVGWLTGGWRGALAAWAGFTIPSALAMTLIALAAVRLDALAPALAGVLAVAAAVVAVAIAAMRSTLAPDMPRLLFAAIVAVALVAFPAPALWPVAIAGGAVFGLLAIPPTPAPRAALDLGVSRPAGIICLAIYALGTVAAFVASASTSGLAGVCATLFAVGATVFGGGHVVLPFLEATAVGHGFISGATLLGGYGAAQAMPGPLFTIASYIGASAEGGRYGIGGAVLGTLAIFAPSFVLLPGAAAFYGALTRNAPFRKAFAGASAAVLGVLCAAFVTPIFTTAISGWKTAVLALLAFVSLQTFKLPAWIVVLAGALAGWMFRF